MLHDDRCRLICGANNNMLVPWFLMSCYAYYELDRPLISDGLFDHLCRKLEARWESVSHPHKGLITLDHLRAGTGVGISYPERTKGAATYLLWEAHAQKRRRKRSPVRH